MKRIIELSIKGVGLALALFAVFGLVADVANQGVFTLKNYNYTKMVIGAVIVGLGFSGPGIVYETTDFSYAVKILIHMGTGCVIFLITGNFLNLTWFFDRKIFIFCCCYNADCNRMCRCTFTGCRHG